MSKNEQSSPLMRRRWITRAVLCAISMGVDPTHAFDKEETRNVRHRNIVVHARRVESAGLNFAEPFSSSAAPILPGALQGKNLTRADSPSRTEPNKDSRIIGGSVVPKGRYPYLVTLFYKDSIGYLTQVCGGSLISPNHVLTAAHCVANTHVVVTGLHDYRNVPTQSYERYDVKDNSILVYPTFTSQNLDGDLAIIVLNTPSRFAPIALNFDDLTPKSAQDMTIMGWGYRENKETTSVPYETVVRHVDTAVCRYRWGDSYIKPRMVCAAGRDGGDTCQGDSGGPLIVKGRASDGSQDTLVGATSWGAECADNYYPGVYARVSECADWIVQIVPSLRKESNIDSTTPTATPPNNGSDGGTVSKPNDPVTPEVICKRENCWYFFWYAWCDNTCD